MAAIDPELAQTEWQMVKMVKDRFEGHLDYALVDIYIREMAKGTRIADMARLEILRRMDKEGRT